MNIKKIGIFLGIVLGLCLLAAGASVALVALGKFPGRTVPVLMYHHITSEKGAQALEVSKKTFDFQMNYLKTRGFEIMDPEELIASVSKNKAADRKAVLTFDDGYEDNYTNALPILEKYGFKGTFFIVFNWVGKSGYMNWEQIRDLKKRGQIIGSHSLNHDLLTELDIGQAKQEIYTSKLLMEEILGGGVQYFCYPNGRYSKLAKEMVQAAGYKAAFTHAPGWAYNNQDVFALKRIRVSESSTNAMQFGWKVSGYYLLLRERTYNRMKDMKP